MSHSIPSVVGATAGAAFVLSVILTPLVRAVARHFGAVAQPKSDRWHKRPTAMFGGVAVFIAVAATLLLFVPMTRDRWIVLGASTVLFAIGLVDDFVQIKPYQKLIGQLLAAGGVVYCGIMLSWTGSYVVNMIVTFVWLVGITNAVNMLDNMDGLAAGVATIAAVFLGLNFLANGQIHATVMLAVFAAALVGFLVYNHNPASIFMGDCGSMFIGFFLASSALLSGWHGGRSRSVVAVLAVPVLVLFVPIFDTTFVTLMRKMAGRAASQGGRDHTSHRLVALGLTERKAVWMLYGCALAAGLLSTLVRKYPIDVSLAAIAGFTTILTILGVYLGRVRVYDESEIKAAREKPLVAFLVDLSYKRRIFEVILDATLIMLSYYLAYALLFGRPLSQSGDWQLFLRTLPVVVSLKLATFLASGIYRGLWRYASVGNVVDYARAVALSSVVTVIVFVFAFRFEGFSRTAFLFDGLLLLMMVTGSRFAFRVLRRMLPAPHTRTGRRVVIYGAGDGGELLARELFNNAALQRVPVAFVDDDPRKTGKLLHGLRVHLADSIAPLCRALKAEEILLSTQKLSLDRVRGLIEEGQAAGISVGRLSLEIRTLREEDVAWVMPSGEGEKSALPAFAESSPLVHITQDHSVADTAAGSSAGAAVVQASVSGNRQSSKLII